MPDMKRCEDCRFYRPLLTISPRCVHPNSEKDDAITGLGYDAALMRSNENYCGKSAKWFKQEDQ